SCAAWEACGCVVVVYDRPVPGTPSVARVPRLEKLRVAPRPPTDSDAPPLLKLTCRPGNMRMERRGREPMMIGSSLSLADGSTARLRICLADFLIYGSPRNATATTGQTDPGTKLLWIDQLSSLSNRCCALRIRSDSDSTRQRSPPAGSRRA